MVVAVAPAAVALVPVADVVVGDDLSVIVVRRVVTVCGAQKPPYQDWRAVRSAGFEQTPSQIPHIELFSGSSRVD